MTWHDKQKYGMAHKNMAWRGTRNHDMASHGATLSHEANMTASCNTVGGKNSATPAAFAFFENQRPTSNFGRKFGPLWIFRIFIFFMNFRGFLMICLVNFDVHHSPGHLGWGRKGIALFLQSGKHTWPEWPEIAGSKRFQANGSRKQ